MAERWEGSSGWVGGEGAAGNQNPHEGPIYKGEGSSSLVITQGTDEYLCLFSRVTCGEGSAF